MFIVVVAVDALYRFEYLFVFCQNKNLGVSEGLVSDLCSGKIESQNLRLLSRVTCYSLHMGEPLRDRLAIDTRCDLKPVQVEKSNKSPRGVK